VPERQPPQAKGSQKVDYSTQKKERELDTVRNKVSMDDMVDVTVVVWILGSVPVPQRKKKLG
jgi:hypothetical protein